MFDLVLFDLDGTLVDTAGDICDTANDVLLSLGLPAVEEARARSWIGQGSRELMIRAYAHAVGVSEAAIRQGSGVESLMALFSDFHERRCGQRSSLYPQVRETLDILQALGIGMALLTNRERRFARTVLERHGLQDYFDPLIAGDTLPVRKPDPQTVEYCLREYGVPAERALLVGDSEVDIATGRNAGIACWVVPYGYNGGRPITDGAPERVIPDLSWVAAAAQARAADRHTPAPALEETPSWH